MASNAAVDQSTIEVAQIMGKLKQGFGHQQQQTQYIDVLTVQQPVANQLHVNVAEQVRQLPAWRQRDLQV